MEPCGCDIIFYGLMSDMGAEIKFCPVHEAAPAMQIKLQAAEEMAMAATHFLSMRFEIFPSVSGKEECKALHGFEAALTAWEKAGKGDK